ncbi:MAG: indolepyruvate ferredoxin oxidoreductase family protein, partial [Hyphomicrobiales bacterium]|nr:indolepyruvate ferredoxin oxidoreductase family protein [Hyphomicrobiales bacterium]
IVEERREIIENQVKQHLFNWRADVRPRVIGKLDEQDRHFLALNDSLTVGAAARAIADRVLRFDFDAGLKKHIAAKLAWLEARYRTTSGHRAPVTRRPYYCSGCPHNTSTRVPAGSRALAGIGCHFMAQWMDRHTETFTQMGGEGVTWTGTAPFTSEKHIFANLGDGTYFHSGLLAIRQAVSAGANITYKVLYNDAVAMTGGQPIDGKLTPEQITHQLHQEGVAPIYLLSDVPEAYRQDDLATGVVIRGRDHIDNVMETVRQAAGCSAIVYVQTCAAEKRRRRKRGEIEDPALHVVINDAVCEGCGDCSEQSNCLSVEPFETPFGRKRRINQSSCNKDFSCLKGFCPAFVTIRGGEVRKKPLSGPAGNADLPEPEIVEVDERPWNIAVTGVGGTGVLTIGAILGMAAHIDGKAPMVLDMTGLAQKGGAVLSHIRIGRVSKDVTSPRIATGSADVLIAADDVVAASKEGVTLCDAERTHAVVNIHATPVADFVAHRDFDFKARSVESVIGERVKPGGQFVDFTRASEALIGDAIATNIMMTGFAWQSGLIPLSRAAIEQAIELNGIAVAANLASFRWGRKLAVEPESVEEAMSTTPEAALQDDMSLTELISHRSAHLTAYQDGTLAERYRALVGRARQAAAGLGLDDAVPIAVARTYARVLAYKDEYEVARLLSDPAFQARLDEEFEGDTRIRFNLAPPFLPGRAPDGRPRKREFGRWMIPLLKVLARMKRLRSTRLDIFARAPERRMERALIGEYEALVDDLLQRLSCDNADTVCALVSLYDEMRGYGPVKHAAISSMHVRQAGLLAELEACTAGAALTAAG